MITKFGLAALALIASISGASAAYNVDFTLADDVGTPFCDGLKLKETAALDGRATGIHTGCTNGDYAGGLVAHVTGVTHNVWMITTTDTLNAPGYVYMYLINQKARTYTLYSESTEDQEQFNVVRTGTLIDNKMTTVKSGAVPSTSIRK